MNKESSPRKGIDLSAEIEAMSSWWLYRVHIARVADRAHSSFNN